MECKWFPFHSQAKAEEDPKGLCMESKDPQAWEKFPGARGDEGEEL